MIFGPDLNHLIKVDHPEIVPTLKDFTCLGLIKERILPHVDREKYAMAHKEIIKQWGDKILLLRDDQVLVVNGDKIEVVTKKNDTT